MKIIGKIEKGTDEIRVILHEWRDQVYCDVRLWYQKNGQFHPGTKGLRFHAELLPELRSALEEAEGVIERGEKIGGTDEAGEAKENQFL